MGNIIFVALCMLLLTPIVLKILAEKSKEEWEKELRNNMKIDKDMETESKQDPDKDLYQAGYDPYK